MARRVSRAAIQRNIRAAQDAGLTITGIAPDGTLLTSPTNPPPTATRDAEDDLCRKLFLREAS